MKDKFTNDKGNSLVELIMVMLLLVLFGVTIYTIIIAGSNTQSKIFNEKNAQVDARIALSYLNVKIRQNDAEGRLEITKNPDTGENSLKIYEFSSYGGSDNATWIYFKEGKILECYVDADSDPIDDFSNTIVNVVDFETAYDADKNAIKNTIVYDYNGEERTMSSTIALKTQVAE